MPPFRVQALVIWLSIVSLKDARVSLNKDGTDSGSLSKLTLDVACIDVYIYFFCRLLFSSHLRHILIS
jgi:hypothetical protein